MPSYLYEEYDAYFRESDEWVRVNYFSERESLFVNKTIKSSGQQLPEAELIRVANFVNEIWNDK